MMIMVRDGSQSMMGREVVCHISCACTDVYVKCQFHLYFQESFPAAEVAFRSIRGILTPGETIRGGFNWISGNQGETRLWRGGASRTGGGAHSGYRLQQCVPCTGFYSHRTGTIVPTQSVLQRALKAPTEEATLKKVSHNIIRNQGTECLTEDTPRCQMY